MFLFFFLHILVYSWVSSLLHHGIHLSMELSVFASVFFFLGRIWATQKQTIKARS
jgi:hypothetical protein